MTTAIFLLSAALVVAYLMRLEGDESIGFGGTFEINDGDADAFVIVPKVETLGVPNYTTGTVESKRLDLDQATVKKLATLHTGNAFTAKIQAIGATVARIAAIKTARVEKKFRVSVPLDTGMLQVTVPGIITQNPIEDLESEKITVINLTVEVSGPVTA